MLFFLNGIFDRQVVYNLSLYPNSIIIHKNISTQKIL